LGTPVTVLVIDPERGYHRGIGTGETPVDDDGNSLVVEVEALATTELDYNKVLQPDGVGGVAWQAYDPVIEGDLDMQCNDLLHVGGIYFCDFGSSSGSGSSGETDLWIRPDYATGEQLEYHAEGGHRFESPVWFTGILTMSTVGAHVYLGANGIGRDAPVLTFATGGAGKATLAGALDTAGRIGAPVGAVGTPGLSFAAQTDLGFYMIGVAEMGITVGGIRQGSWTATGLSLTGLAMTGNVDMATNSILNINSITVDGTAYITSGALHVGESDAETGWIYLYGAASPSVVGGVAVFYAAADYATSYRIRVTEDDFEFCAETTPKLTYQGATNTWLFSVAVDFDGNDLMSVGTITADSLTLSNGLDMGCSDILYAQGLYFCDVGSSSGSGSSGLSDIWIRPDLNTAGQLEYHAEGGHRFESPAWFTGTVYIEEDLQLSSTGWVGMGAAAGRFVFDSTPTPDTITLTGANLYVGTNGIGNNAAVLTFDEGAWATATFQGSISLWGNMLLNAGYIGGDEGVLTFASGTTGAASFAGSVYVPSTFEIGMSAKGRFVFADATPDTITVTDANLYVGANGIGNNSAVLSFAESGSYSTATFVGGIVSGGDISLPTGQNVGIAAGPSWNFSTDGYVALHSGNLHIGAYGIGNDAPVLTFAASATGAASFAGAILATGRVETSDAFYLGDPATDGSWRIRRVDWDLVFEQRDSEGWHECDRIASCASSSGP